MTTSSWTPARLAALKLASCSPIGSRTLKRIRDLHPNPDAFLHDPSCWKTTGLTEAQRRALTATKPNPELLDRENIRFLLPEDVEFPALLLKQPDPPYALFLRGAPIKDELRIAVVGTRGMTAYGKHVTRVLAGELARSGVTIVSGLALGIDAEAHEACLTAGGRTIAVLPGGVDEASVTPRQNFPLAERILDQGGTLLSEYPPGAPVREFSFLHRNRHVAALSSAVVVPEADRDSGALVTARLALECGREVLAVPGSILVSSSRGTNWLIGQGAHPCCSADDVFSAIGFSHPEQAKTVSEMRASLPLTPEEERVLEVLSEPRSADEIARLTKDPISKISTTISLLELKGRIISVGPRTFVRAP